MTEGKTALDRLNEIAARADSSDVPLLVAALKDVLDMERRPPRLDRTLGMCEYHPADAGYNAALDEALALIERRLET